MICILTKEFQRTSHFLPGDCIFLTLMLRFLCQLYDKLQDYVTDHEREDMSAKLQQTEDWLYEDGEDEIKSVYIAKLVELRKV